MKEPKAPSIMEEEEERVQEKLKTALQTSVPFLNRAFNLIQHAMQPLSSKHLSDLSASSKACVNLLIRCSSALRAITILCEQGYALEAFGSAATLFESSWTIAYVGNDDNSGREWELHVNPKKTFGENNWKSVVKQGLRKLGHSSDDPSVDAKYILYRKLCVGKHVNPLVQSYDAVLQDEDLILFQPGPRADIYEVMKAWFVCLAAIKAVAPGIESFLTNQILPIHASSLKDELNTLMLESEEQEKLFSQYLNERNFAPHFKNKVAAFRQFAGL